MKIFLTIAAAVLILKLVRHRHRRHRRWGYRACAHHGGHHGHRHWRGPSSSRGPGARVAERLEHALSLSPEQSNLVREQIKLFRARMDSLEVPTQTRHKLAAVMRSESFDENILGELFVEHDDAMRTLRLEAVERLAAVHDALDDGQREALASLLEKGMGARGGPYRG